ncbi:hypothetical protein BDV98DRAFT_595777 [Pterulicium gracile]|uniref:Uncharacterized protein n=1 Tax=Pterulicium gracile TaxID=1884261 RepID=A0A5C3Q915_9AGAR|nr:hypothetical protein BDV98DRAFT_595777 [Pterula gracilis]
MFRAERLRVDLQYSIAGLRPYDLSLWFALLLRERLQSLWFWRRGSSQRWLFSATKPQLSAGQQYPHTQQQSPYMQAPSSLVTYGFPTFPIQPAPQASGWAWSGVFTVQRDASDNAYYSQSQSWAFYAQQR